jgi:predicted nucleic acid-binding protein
VNLCLVDTDVVSILFSGTDPRWVACAQAVSGRESIISFVTLAELLAWPKSNNWGAARAAALREYLGDYTVLLPDEQTCEVWSEIRVECSLAGRPISQNDAWVAAIARQWDIELLTGNFRDYVGVSGLRVVPIE